MIKLPLLISLFFSFNLAYSQDFCEQKTVSKSNEVKYTTQKSIKVNDVEGHVIRIFKTETNHKNPEKNCEDLKILRTDFFGISDYINKNGSVIGYSISTFEDGSKIFSDFKGIAQSPKDQAKNGVVVSTVKITGGTGVYKGVSGHGRGKVEFNPETGYSSGYNEIFYKVKE